MLETVRYEAERARFSAIVLAVGLAAYAGLYVILAPAMIESIDWQSFIDLYPDALVEAFGLRHLGTMGGLLAAQVYKFGWVVVLGLYVAYAAASLVAGDVESDRMDLLLAGPVSRTRILAEKYVSLAIPVAFATITVGLVAAVGPRLIGYPIPLERVAMVHLLALPYLACCGAIGLVLSVLAPRRVVAEGAAIGAVVGGFLVETMTRGTTLDVLGALTPVRYYDPISVLALGEYDLGGGAVLVLATAALLVVARTAFVRRDIG